MPPADGGHSAGTHAAPAIAADAGAGAGAAAAAGSGPVRSRSGPTRATPVVLLALAGVLLAARVGLGVYEEGRPV
jgi:hypothetical protein